MNIMNELANEVVEVDALCLHLHIPRNQTHIKYGYDYVEKEDGVDLFLVREESPFRGETTSQTQLLATVSPEQMSEFCQHPETLPINFPRLVEEMRDKSASFAARVDRRKAEYAALYEQLGVARYERQKQVRTEAQDLILRIRDRVKTDPEYKQRLLDRCQKVIASTSREVYSHSGYDFHDDPSSYFKSVADGSEIVDFIEDVPANLFFGDFWIKDINSLYFEYRRLDLFHDFYWDEALRASRKIMSGK